MRFARTVLASSAVVALIGGLIVSASSAAAAPTRSAKVTISVSKNPSTYGVASRATIKVTYVKAKLSGRVDLYDGSKRIGKLPLKNNTASMNLPKNPAVGPHKLVARYIPAGADAARYKMVKSNPFTWNAGPKKDAKSGLTSLGLNPSVVKPNGTMRITAKPYNGIPKGTVTFYVNGKKVKTGKYSNGVATFDYVNKLAAEKSYPVKVVFTTTDKNYRSNTLSSTFKSSASGASEPSTSTSGGSSGSSGSTRSVPPAPIRFRQVCVQWAYYPYMHCAQSVMMPY